MSAPHNSRFVSHQNLAKKAERTSMVNTVAVASQLDINEQTLRIGMFSESFHPVQNGVTTSVLTLVAALRGLNHHVCVFAPAHQELREPQTHVMRFPSFVSFLNREYPVAYPFLPRLALETHFDNLKLDIVHTHTPFVLGLTGAKLALRRNIPLVSTFHTLYSQYTHYVPILPDTVTQALLEHYIPWYYNRCAEIICPSEVAAAALREMGVARPIQIIPTGIPLAPADVCSTEARGCTRAMLGVQPDTPLLLYAGRLAREKNLDLLMQAFILIHDRLPSTRLAMVGAGPYAEELREQARAHNLDTAILFLGPRARRQMDPLFAAADVFCFPSTSETQGLVIGEARAAGTPSVVADAGGGPETVAHGTDGFRVSPDSPTEFADYVLRILTNPTLARSMRQSARRNALAFTPERMVQKVLAVYDRARSQAPPDGTPLPQDFPEELDWEALT
jgi:1,2-diacylglycerol 3-alpha-glucosyltransferase